MLHTDINEVGTRYFPFLACNFAICFSYVSAIRICKFVLDMAMINIWIVTMRYQVSHWKITNYVVKFYKKKKKVGCTNILVMSFQSSSESQFCCAQHSITRVVVCCCVGHFVTFPICVSVELALCRSFATCAPLLQ